MTSKEKIIELQNWFNKNNIEYHIAKTNSIYIENKNYEVIKISNHQLIKNISNPYSRKKEMLKANNDYLRTILKNMKWETITDKIENYKVYKNEENNIIFADIEKYTYDYNNIDINSAPNYWIPISGNWSLEKVKNIIKELL